MALLIAPFFKDWELNAIVKLFSNNIKQITIADILTAYYFVPNGFLRMSVDCF